MEQNIVIKKYIIKFSIAYAIGLVAITAIFIIFDLDHSSGASIGALIGAAMYSVGKFIEENKRILNKIEKSKLVWFSLISSYITSIVVAIIVISLLDGIQGLSEFAKLIEKLNVVIITGATVVVSLIYFIVLSWSYGGLAKKQYEGLQKKGKI